MGDESKLMRMHSQRIRAELKEVSLCSDEADTPSTAASASGFCLDADESVPASLAGQSTREVSVRNSSRRCCKPCGLAFRGFGGTCGSCRKVGRRGSIRRCVSCSEFFSGFHATCEDC